MTHQEYAERLAHIASSGITVEEFARRLEEGRRRIGVPAAELLRRLKARQ